MAEKREQDILSSYHYISEKTSQQLTFPRTFTEKSRSHHMRVPFMTLSSHTLFSPLLSGLRGRGAPCQALSPAPHSGSHSRPQLPLCISFLSTISSSLLFYYFLLLHVNKLKFSQVLKNIKIIHKHTHTHTPSFRGQWRLPCI